MNSITSAKFTVISIGLIITLLASFMWWNITYPPKSWLSASGIIKDRRHTSGSWRPVVEYRATDGTVHTFTSNIGGSFGPAIGDKVTVYYSPHNPSQAKVAPTDGQNFLYFALGIFGLLLAATQLVPKWQAQWGKRSAK